MGVWDIGWGYKKMGCMDRMHNGASIAGSIVGLDLNITFFDNNVGLVFSAFVVGKMS
jgi:hypothetical protein